MRGVQITTMTFEALDKKALLLTISGKALDVLAKRGVTIDTLRDSMQSGIESLITEAK